jgi:hypothetical protein
VIIHHSLKSGVTLPSKVQDNIGYRARDEQRRAP